VTPARAFALAFVAIAALSASGCAALVEPTPTPTSIPTIPSGIAGRVLIGPTCLGPGPTDTADASGPPDESPTEGPTFDPDATPEPPASVDPDATDDPDTTPYPSGCSRPYVATLAVIDALDDTTRARVKSAEDGSFRVDVPPGDYTVVPENGDPFPMAQPVDVTVVAGDYATVEINYDTGAR
jgi:hypothetical protein